MALLRNLIQRWKSGDPIMASRLNAQVDLINEQIKNVASPSKKNVKPVVRQAISQFKVVSVDGDFLVCNSYYGDQVTTDEVNVAKPYLLRRTPFDNLSRDSISYTYSSDIERQADDSSNTEDQVIVPSYVVGDIIYAVNSPIGGTEVTDNSNIPVSWVDINIDGRAWAKVNS